MDGLIGFVIFLIIAVVSVIKRVQEAQQEEEERRRAASKTRPEDLPEATRRMLYGDTGVPTARERRAPQEPPIVVARPRQLAEENGEGPRHAPPARPVAVPPPPVPRQTTPTRRPPIPPRPMQPQRPVVVVPRRPAPLAPPPPPSVAREMLAGDRGVDYDVRAAAERNEGEWVLRDQQERRAREEQARRAVAARARAAHAHRLVAHRSDLRRAIVLNEVLGPPIALRDPFGPFQNGPVL